MGTAGKKFTWWNDNQSNFLLPYSVTSVLNPFPKLKVPVKFTNFNKP